MFFPAFSPLASQLRGGNYASPVEFFALLAALSAQSHSTSGKVATTCTFQAAVTDYAATLRTLPATAQRLKALDGISGCFSFMLEKQTDGSVLGFTGTHVHSLYQWSGSPSAIADDVAATLPASAALTALLFPKQNGRPGAVALAGTHHQAVVEGPAARATPWREQALAAAASLGAQRCPEDAQRAAGKVISAIAALPRVGAPLCLAVAAEAAVFVARPRVMVADGDLSNQVERFRLALDSAGLELTEACQNFFLSMQTSTAACLVAQASAPNPAAHQVAMHRLAITLRGPPLAVADVDLFGLAFAVVLAHARRGGQFDATPTEVQLFAALEKGWLAGASPVLLHEAMRLRVTQHARPVPPHIPVASRAAIDLRATASQMPGEAAAAAAAAADAAQPSAAAAATTPAALVSADEDAETASSQPASSTPRSRGVRAKHGAAAAAPPRQARKKAAARATEPAADDSLRWDDDDLAWECETEFVAAVVAGRERMAFRREKNKQNN